MASSALSGTTTVTSASYSASIQYSEQSLVLGNDTSAQAQVSEDAVAIAISGSSTVTISGDGSSGNPFLLTAQEIIRRINEAIKDKLPQGVEGLSPEEATPKATSDRIVSGVTAFFDTFARQHKDLQGDDLVDAFIGTVKSGVQKGYDDAYSILDGIGAFKVNGVKDGVEQTKILVDSKLDSFAVQKKKELAGVSTTPQENSNSTRQTA